MFFISFTSVFSSLWSKKQTHCPYVNDLIYLTLHICVAAWRRESRTWRPCCDSLTRL